MNTPHHPYKPAQLNPVERAVIAQKWRSYALDGQLQAMMGEHTPTVISYCGRMVFVALACAVATGLSADEPDVRVLRGAANALYDQVDCPTVQAERRGALIAGVQAALRVTKAAGTTVVVDQALRMELLLRQRHISRADFAALAQAMGAPAQAYATPATTPNTTTGATA